MLPFGLQIHLSYRISDLLIGSKGMSELWGTFVLETVLWLIQKLVRALSSTISLSLIDKHNRGRTRRECHKCQTVHTEDQHSARTQWCIVPRWLPVIRGKCTLERSLCFPVRRTHSRLVLCVYMGKICYLMTTTGQMIFFTTFTFFMRYSHFATFSSSGLTEHSKAVFP